MTLYAKSIRRLFDAVWKDASRITADSARVARTRLTRSAIFTVD